MIICQALCEALEIQVVKKQMRITAKRENDIA